MAETKRLIVAAIDIGTTYSGYAYAPINDTENIVINFWNSGKLFSRKAPTCLLLNPDQEFDSFGYEAENKYAELVEENKDYTDWYYFYRFKMTLYHNKALKDDMELEDINGKKLNAVLVFSKCIGCLKDHMYKSVKDRILDIQPSEITYVLTVPAIWEDSAKQFMREAAVLGGIADDQLVVALEPEVASIVCQEIPFKRDEGAYGGDKFTIGKPGSKYLIADLGGCTADITVYKKLETGNFKVIHCASGKDMGGKSVDDAFFKFLEELFGKDVMSTFKDSSMEDYIYLLREFETKKTDIREDREKVYISIPVALKTVVKKKKKADMEEVVKRSSFNETVTFTRSQKLQILQNQFRKFFHETVKSIVDLIAEIIGHVGEVNTIVMVGGFSECSLIYLELKKNPVTRNRRLIFPEDAGLAVLKGAVLFGYMSMFRADHQKTKILDKQQETTCNLTQETGTDAQQRLRESEARNEEIENENKTLKDQVDKLTTRLHEAGARNAEIENENKTLKDQVGKIENENKTLQDQVDKLITRKVKASEEKRSMNILKAQIRANYKYLVRETDLLRLTDGMFAKCVFSEEDIGVIKSKETVEVSNRAFLEILFKKKVDSLQAFLQELHTDGRDDVVQIINDTDITGNADRNV